MTGDGKHGRSHAGAELDLRGRLELGLWAVAWFVSPFYLVPQGLPQLYDLLLALQFFGMLLAGRLEFSRRANPALAMLGALVVYIALVGCVWAIVHELVAFVVPAFYYGFDLAVVVVALSLFHHHGSRFLRVTLWSWVLAIMVQVVLVSVMPPGYAGVRGLAFFNDPNQLAVYGVAGGVLIAQVARRVGVRSWLEVAGTVLVGALVVASVSRAGFLAFVALVVVRFTARPRMIVAGLLIGGLGVLLFPWELLPIDFVQERLARAAQESTSTLVHDRGYTRIFEYPQYLLLGAGEGMLSRFGQAIEIHSTPGTLLFCYGIPGVVLFFGACLRILVSASPREGILLLPLLVLSMFHHTLRMRFFWLNLAFAIISGLVREPAARSGRRGDSAGR